MIQKCGTGRGFMGLVAYLGFMPEKDSSSASHEMRGTLIATNMAGKTATQISREFGHWRQLKKTLGKAVFHSSLSLSPEDRQLTDEEFASVAKDYLEGMGFQNCPYLVVNHPDYGSYYAPAQLPANSLFHKFITSSIDDDETRGLVQEFVGSTLITKNFQTALFLYGESAGNGKGTLMNIVQALHQKVATVDLEEFNRFTMASLFGASLVVVDEMPKSIDRGVQKVKSAMTSDTISVERKGKDAVSYRSTAKWIVASNHAPATDNSKGWWRRLLIVPFNKSFTDSGEAIKGLEQMIAVPVMQ